MSEVVYGCVGCDRYMMVLKRRNGLRAFVCSECFAVVEQAADGVSHVESLGKCPECGHWEYTVVSEGEGHYYECDGCGAVKSIEEAVAEVEEL